MDKNKGEVMSEDINLLSVNYEEDDVLLVKELDKEILSKGAWATILFRYQQWNPKDEAYSADKFVIRRYQKLAGVYKYKSKFNISSCKQAKKIVDALNGWLDEIEKE